MWAHIREQKQTVKFHEKPINSIITLPCSQVYKYLELETAQCTLKELCLQISKNNFTKKHFF